MKNDSNKNETQEMARFSFSMPILKCFEEVRLDDHGKEVKERFIEGVASSTDIDLHGDQMAASAIKSMAQSIKEHIIQLNAEHDKSWQSDLGEVSKLSVDKKNRLVMRAKLDVTSKANDLWYALTTKKKELGLSIGGFVKDYILEWDKKKERFKRVFKDIELDHIAVTSTPANPKTWVGAIAKSIDKVERTNDFESLDDMPKDKLVEFIEKTLNTVLGEDNLKKILTNFSFNFNEKTIMSIKKNKTSLESDVNKKESETLENEEESTEETEEKTEEETTKEESTKEETKEEESTEETEEGTEESTEEAEESTEETKEEESNGSETEESGEEKAETEKEEKDEEKSLSKEETQKLIQEGLQKGIKEFFSNLLGTNKKKTETDKTEEKKETEETEKSEDDTENNVLNLLKDIVSRQDKLDKKLDKKVINRKTVKSVAITNNDEEEKAEEGVYKTLEEELEAVRKKYSNDSERAFTECGKVRKSWAEKE